MEVDGFVEKHINCWMPGFTPDEDNWTAFHSSPVSRFLSIAHKGLRDSVAAEGRRSGVYSRQRDFDFSSPVRDRVLIHSLAVWPVAHTLLASSCLRSALWFNNCRSQLMRRTCVSQSRNEPVTSQGEHHREHNRGVGLINPYFKAYFPTI